MFIIGCLRYKIMSSTNKATSASSFHVCISLIDFFYLTALGMASGTVLNRSDGRERPCRVPSISGDINVNGVFLHVA